MLPALTEASVEAMNNLRSGSDFRWYLVALLAFVAYVYVVEVERKRWDIVIAGVFFFGIEFTWEILNALVLHFSNYAAMWSTPGDTAYLIFAGLTIEIAMMFSVAGVMLTKTLPPDPGARVLGIPNRVLYVLVFALICVFVEVILNQWGVLVWDYSWWNWPNVWLIVLAYFIGFGICALFYDLGSMKLKLGVTAGVYCLDIVLVILFVVVLEWI